MGIKVGNNILNFDFNHTITTRREIFMYHNYPKNFERCMNRLRTIFFEP